MSFLGSIKPSAASLVTTCYAERLNWPWFLREEVSAGLVQASLKVWAGLTMPEEVVGPGTHQAWAQGGGGGHQEPRTEAHSHNPVCPPPGASLPLACGPAGWQVSFLPPSLHLGGAALGPVIHSVNHLLVELSGKRQ